MIKVEYVSRDLKRKRVFDITKHNDSIAVLSIGSSDAFLGATRGYSLLNRQNKIGKAHKYIRRK